ncbi:hypothetical protein [Candidatus Gromoviella agglomerans]|uniref:hypothetical protein n=1 Tax=Candidatus Gromoviella agglomerans TaxID=2806609 RepID=UPI001E611C73|nr:hypothetical protein [Candidatus Gromoviella agglomerans]UFX98394.1 hypothetical protein Gromo_00290 [Candidatus Gromoviella agglomerans]
MKITLNIICLSLVLGMLNTNGMDQNPKDIYKSMTLKQLNCDNKEIENITKSLIIPQKSVQDDVELIYLNDTQSILDRMNDPHTIAPQEKEKINAFVHKNHQRIQILINKIIEINQFDIDFIWKNKHSINYLVRYGKDIQYVIDAMKDKENIFLTNIENISRQIIDEVDKANKELDKINKWSQMEDKDKNNTKQLLENNVAMRGFVWDKAQYTTKLTMFDILSIADIAPYLQMKRTPLDKIIELFNALDKFTENVCVTLQYNFLITTDKETRLVLFRNLKDDKSQKKTEYAQQFLNYDSWKNVSDQVHYKKLSVALALLKSKSVNKNAETIKLDGIDDLINSLDKATKIAYDAEKFLTGQAISFIKEDQWPIK